MANRDPGEAWKAAGSKAKTARSLQNAASRAAKRPEVAQALADHLDQVGEVVEAAAEQAAAEVELGGIAADASREGQIQRLAVRASGDAIHHLVTVQPPIYPDPDLIRAIADEPDPGLRSEALRRMLAVTLTPWKDVPREYLAQVAEVSQAKDGTVRIKTHSPGPAETLLAEIQGHKSETPRERAARELADVLRIAFAAGIGGEVAGAIRDKAGPEVAEAVARMIEAQNAPDG